MRFFIYLPLGLAIFSGIVLTGFGIYLATEPNWLQVTDGTDFDLNYILALAVPVVIALGIATIAKAIYFIIFVSKIDDDTLAENRWIMVVALSGSMFMFLPMFLHRTGGYGTNPDAEAYPARFNLGRWLSLTSFISGATWFISFIIMSKQLFTGSSLFAPYQNNLGVDPNNFDIYNITFYVELAVFALFLGIGVLTIPAFYIPGAKTAYNSQDGSFWKGYMVFWGYIFTVYATLLMILSMISAVFEIINAFGRAFGSNRSVLDRIFYALSLPLIIAYQGFIIYTCGRTIEGLWRKEDTIQYNTFSQLRNRLDAKNTESNYRENNF